MVEAAEVQAELKDHRIEYERRHGEIKTQIATLEANMLNVATKGDLAQMKTDIVKELSQTIATSTDVDWLKRAFWILAASMITFSVSVGGLLLNHIFRP